jgi:hypothetical protein
MSLNKSAQFAGFTALLLVSSLVGCSLSDIRKVTYPPDFNYIEPQEIRTGMTKMAAQIRLLDIALQASVTDPDAKATQQKRVMAALNNIENIASGLQGNPAGSNHPYMQDFMAEFVAKVDKARSAASLAEPRYYYAGKVAGACTVCHQINRS